MEAKHFSRRDCLTLPTDQATVEELEALREIERTMREFVEKFDGFPSYLWAAPTAKIGESVKFNLSSLRSFD